MKKNKIKKLKNKNKRKNIKIEYPLFFEKKLDNPWFTITDTKFSEKYNIKYAMDLFLFSERLDYAPNIEYEYDNQDNPGMIRLTIYKKMPVRKLSTLLKNAKGKLKVSTNRIRIDFKVIKRSDLEHSHYHENEEILHLDKFNYHKFLVIPELYSVFEYKGNLEDAHDFMNYVESILSDHDCFPKFELDEELNKIVKVRDEKDADIIETHQVDEQILRVKFPPIEKITEWK